MENVRKLSSYSKYFPYRLEEEIHVRTVRIYEKFCVPARVPRTSSFRSRPRRHGEGIDFNGIMRYP